MDQRLFKAIVSNDVPTFVNLVRQNQDILKQRSETYLNTPLHIASRFGHIKLTMEIVALCPDMVAAENKKLETPLHEACRQGNTEVLRMLLETNPWAACKLNYKRQSPLFIACSYGHLNLVNILLNQHWLLDLEEGQDDTSLHVAASKGQTEVVRRIIEVWPDLAQKIDGNGFSPLHCACSRGHLEISTMLLRLDPDMALQFNNSGYTPLHLAAMSDNAAILKEFLSIGPHSFHCSTMGGETVFHLTARFNKCDAFKYLAQVFKDTNLFDQPDQYGNTILHLAAAGGHSDLGDFITSETTVQINYRNNRGFTALDILDQLGSTLENQHLEDMLKKAGGRRSNELESSKDEFDDTLEWLFQEPAIQLENNEPIISNNLNNTGTLISGGDDAHQYQIEEKVLSESEPESMLRKRESTTSPTNLRLHKHLSEGHRKELVELYKIRHSKQHEIHREALQNARNTITLVAILIATVTFSAGISPPGGVYQEGIHKGKSIAGRTTAFKIFIISNNVALFTSLCIVIVLVSIIPFRRKPLMRLLVLAHKVMWVSASFMAMAFVAATWVIMPHDEDSKWMPEFLLTICIVTVGSMFVGLGITLARHRLRKSKWKEERANRKETASSITVENQEIASAVQTTQSSSNSDVASSQTLGYHAL